DPFRSRRSIARRDKRPAQQIVNLVGTVAMDVGPQHPVGIRADLWKDSPFADVLQYWSHVFPIVGAHPAVVLFPEPCLDGRARMLNGVAVLSLLPQNDCHAVVDRSEEHTSELQSLRHLVCRLLL